MPTALSLLSTRVHNYQEIATKTDGLQSISQSSEYQVTKPTHTERLKVSPI